MSDQNKHPEATNAVDWAERLKASMNQSSAESPREEPSHEEPSHEQDDLAALLRAQLNKNQATEHSLEIPDTSEFEIPAAEDVEEESVEDDFEDEDFEEDFEENIEEDDPEEEDFDENIEEDYPEEEDFDENIEEDYPEEEDFDENIEEDYPEEEEFEENIEEDYPEEEEYAEETPADDFFEPVPEPPTIIPPQEPPTVPVASYRRPAGDAWTDDRLNGQITPDAMGGRRLHELAMENQRLVSESMAIPEPEIPEEPIPVSDPADTPASDHVTVAPDSPPQEKSEPERPQILLIRDPLQLGLDDISHTVKSPRAAAPAEAPPPQKAEEEAPKGSAAPAETDQPTPPPAPASIEKDTSLSDTDLYMRLGYDEALHRADEQMRVERLMTEVHEKRDLRTSGEHPSVKASREYHGREDTDRIEGAYSRTRRTNIARLVVSSMGTLIALAYDLLAVLPPNNVTSAVTDSPYYAPVGLLWTLLICLPFLSRLGRGCKGLIDFEPTRYTVSAVAILVSAINEVMSWIAGPAAGMPLFGGAALLMLTVAVLADLLVTEGEYRAFSVVSSGKKAHVLTDETTPASLALSETQGKVFTAVRTGRVADYFTRTGRYNPYMGRLNYFLPVTFLLAIVCVGLEVALGGDLMTDGVRVFTAAYMTCLPSAYLLAMTLPLWSVNGYLKEKGAAVIGTAAPTDYAGKAARVIFSDGDTLKAINRKDITLRGDDRSEEYRRQAEIVFRFLQTPLATDPILREGKTDHYTIEIAAAEEQYVRLYLVDTRENTSTEIMMGSHTALTRRGVRLPKLNMELRYKKSEGSHVLYVAFNRNFHLAYAVEYRVGRQFLQMAESLQKMGYAVSVFSFDPLVDPTSEGLRPLREQGITEVLRPAAYEPIRKARSGGLIATGHSADLWHTLRACRAMLNAYRREHLCSWLSLIVAMGLVIPAICLDRQGLLISATVALWQLCHVGISLWISLAAAGRKQLDRDAAPQSPEPVAETPAPAPRTAAQQSKSKKTKTKRTRK